jgi:hypothetical protein
VRDKAAIALFTEDSDNLLRDSFILERYVLIDDSIIA